MNFRFDKSLRDWLRVDILRHDCEEILESWVAGQHLSKEQSDKLKWIANGEPEFFTKKELQAKTGLTDSGINYHMKHGLKFHKRGRTPYFERTDVEEYFSRNNIVRIPQ